jgi:tetratricopeptide (TPR) repeat protein
MIAEVKGTPVAALPSSTATSVVLGANSAFEAGSELPVHLDFTSLEAATDSNLVLSTIGGGGRFFKGIAATARHRAEHHLESAAAWTHAGFAALADQSLAKAREAFDRALDINPSHRNAILGLARTCHQAGELDRAEQLLRDLIVQSPADVEARVSLAVVLVSQGHPEAGLATLGEEVLEASEHASFLAARGSIELLLGHVQAAIADLRKAVRLKPEWVHPRNVLGLAEFRAGRLRAAERHFMAAVRTAPMHEPSLLNLSNVLRMQHRWEEMLTHIERYWRPGAASARIARRAAEACLEINNPRLARGWLEPVRGQGSSIEEQSAILNNLGVAYSRLKQWSQAEAAFAESIAAQATDVNVANRARILLETGANDEAIAWLSQWLSRENVVGAGIETTLAGALVAQRQYEQALRVVKDAVHRADATEATFGILSFLYADYLHDYEGATRVTLQGLERCPNSSPLINNLAYALLMADRVADAAAWLESIDYDRLPAAQRVYVLATTGLLELKRGHLHEGRQLYEAALGLAGSEDLRARVKAKRDLEVARALMHVDNAAGEAVRLLQRASEGVEGAEPYVSHAREELRRLKAGAD